MENKYICIHGHFYQPPRENPWLDEIETEDSAYPYPNWNERITEECYSANAFCRFVDAPKKSVEIVNNYTKISFNFGPTLLSWLKRKQPEVYQTILEADQESQKRFSGHGAALAQAYNHIIMPLASSWDKRTQVLWGIKDFEHRFKRKPEGMWLPETAVDLETLDILSEYGIRFTILAPHQAAYTKSVSDGEWEEVSGGRIDPTQPYLCRLPSGRSIALFFYHGPLAHGVAFGGFLRNGEELAQRFGDTLNSPTDRDLPRLLHIAVDGETYGHHHRFGDMALAHCLDSIQTKRRGDLTIYAEFLERFPPSYEVKIQENTSWSCSHGVERWRADCGCHTGPHPGWNQKWRVNLRQAIDWLRNEFSFLYAKEMQPYISDPWRLRDEYIDVILDRSPENLRRFFQKSFSKALDDKEKARILKLLELQHHGLLMQTSCGWFFDDISGLESVQVMKYAGRAIQLARQLTEKDLEPGFLQFLSSAPSNVPEFANGALIYEKLVKPAILDTPRVGAHYAITSLFIDYPKTAHIYSYTVEKDPWTSYEKDGQSVHVGQVKIRSDITQEEDLWDVVVFSAGDYRIRSGVRPSEKQKSLDSFSAEIQAALKKEGEDRFLKIEALMKSRFGGIYDLWDVFRSEREKILDDIFTGTFKAIEGFLKEGYKKQSLPWPVKKQKGIHATKALSALVEFAFDRNLLMVLDNESLDLLRLQRIAEEFKDWSFDRDKVFLSFSATQRLNRLMREALSKSDLASLNRLHDFLAALRKISLHPNLWKAQNFYFLLQKTTYPQILNRAQKGDSSSQDWIKAFDDLAGPLHINPDFASPASLLQSKTVGAESVRRAD